MQQAEREERYYSWEALEPLIDRCRERFSFCLSQENPRQDRMIFDICDQFTNALGSLSPNNPENIRECADELIRIIDEIQNLIDENELLDH
ncbi:unnamed protein product [Caenorhabditis bovis]|uniref:Uncharacterized protein n=1 Tax=Caenorhabditis bovis TaxID=2654633 RepID=A0A8S1FF79_9PELO|nr:unnamed protein product [Caenorhabditis bovis]